MKVKIDKKEKDGLKKGLSYMFWNIYVAVVIVLFMYIAFVAGNFIGSESNPPCEVELGGEVVFKLPSDELSDQVSLEGGKVVINNLKLKVPCNSDAYRRTMDQLSGGFN